MYIHVDFDIILIAIFVTIFITGYIRGAGIELLRVLKVIIPFFVLYFYGDKINQLLFSSHNVVEFVYQILPDIPYRNTIAYFSTQIIVYVLVYVFLAIFLWRLGKYVLDERIEFWFGRFNSIFGGIFSVIRMYIIVSIIILPFFALNFTNHDDPITNFILNNPPRFSRIGLLIDKAKPTLDKVNEVSSSLKIMDLKSLENYTILLIDVKEFVLSNEEEAYKIYIYLKERNSINETFTKSEFLYYYINNIDIFDNFSDDSINKINHQLKSTIMEYKSVFIWAYEHEVLKMETKEEIINSFIDNYPKIIADTNEKLTIEVLRRIKVNTQVYLIIKEWLSDYYHIEVQDGLDLLNDNYLETVLDSFDLYKDQLISLFKEKLEQEYKDSIIKQVERFARFQEEYIKYYKPKIKLYDELFTDVTFKYKLMFAIMKEKKLNTVINHELIDKNSLMYLFILDSLNFLNYFSADEKIYYEAAQVYIALFLIDIDENTQIKKLTFTDFYQHLMIFSQNEDLFKRTKGDINKIIRALLVENEGMSYLEYLLNNDLCEPDFITQLLNHEEIRDIFTLENYILLERINRKMLSEN